jgi:dihydrofolate reductase
MISLIAAMAKNRAIGKDNKIPWHLPEDLKHFKALTLGKVILMGRKTYESIGKPLPKRINIVISSNMEIPVSSLDKKDETMPALLVYRDIESAITASQSFINHFELPNEIMIVGGTQIYSQCIDICDRMYLTVLDSEYEGDAFFPEFDTKNWTTSEEEKHENYRYVTYDRK